MDRPLTDEDRRDFAACRTLAEALKVLSGCEVVEGRHANWRTLYMASEQIRKNSEADDKAIRDRFDERT